jgi:hypothetical protein
MVAPVDGANPSEQLALQVAAHDLQSSELVAFFQKFGTLKHLDSNSLSPQVIVTTTTTVMV